VVEHVERLDVELRRFQNPPRVGCLPCHRGPRHGTRFCDHNVSERLDPRREGQIIVVQKGDEAPSRFSHAHIEWSSTPTTGDLDQTHTGRESWRESAYQLQYARSTLGIEFVPDHHDLKVVAALAYE
jgi:hypothetical protein